MSRLWDVVIGGGIVVCLLALVACCVQAVLEVLAVERDRRKMSGEVRAEAHDTPDPARSAPSPDDDRWPAPTDKCGRCGHTRMVHEPHCVVTFYAAKRPCPSNCREFTPIEVPDDLFAETVRRAHPDLTEWR